MNVVVFLLGVTTYLVITFPPFFLDSRDSSASLRKAPGWILRSWVERKGESTRNIHLLIPNYHVKWRSHMLHLLFTWDLPHFSPNNN